MSKLKELIQKLCPDGVEFEKLGTLLDYEQPAKYIVKSTDYSDSYPIPVLTAGQTFILGYTNETKGIYVATKDNPTIIFDDFTTSFHWVDFNFKIKSSAMKMLRPKVSNISFKYIYYAMKCINYQPVDHSRHWISKYSQFEIPMPPLDVQNEIVRILDTFTSHTAELQAELQARKEQYEYYRNKLLTFDKDDKNVKWMKLGEISNVVSGKNKEKNSIGTYPVYGSTGIIAYTENFSYCDERILVARVGANAGYTHIASGKYDVSDNTLVVDVKGHINFKYVYYSLVNLNLNKYAKGGGQPLITAGEIKTIQIPIPPLSEQQRIVSILDKFESLVNNLTEGLPAEIAAVQEQYEYYRNKLLSFPEIKEL